MTRRLVFVHGRAQEFKDATAIKAEWVSTLAEGLAKNGLKLPIGESDIRFPYYGDTLYDLVKGVPPERVANVIVRGDNADDEEKDFISEVLRESARARGVTDNEVEAVLGRGVIERGPLNWEWVQGILRAIDKHVPGGSGKALAIATRDVYQYLRNPGIRDEIESGVRAAFTPGIETVVVAHSLGTVVAYNLLKREGAAAGWNVPLFVTVGSPLAVTAIKRVLAPIGSPACVGKWFNAMDAVDVVSLYPLDAANFAIDPPIENKTDVKNQTENHHGIVGYLNDGEVAKKIFDALRS